MNMFKKLRNAMEECVEVLDKIISTAETEDAESLERYCGELMIKLIKLQAIQESEFQ